MQNNPQNVPWQDLLATMSAFMGASTQLMNALNAKVTTGQTLDIQPWMDEQRRCLGQIQQQTQRVVAGLKANANAAAPKQMKYQEPDDFIINCPNACNADCRNSVEDTTFPSLGNALNVSGLSGIEPLKSKDDRAKQPLSSTATPNNTRENSLEGRHSNKCIRKNCTAWGGLSTINKATSTATSTTPRTNNLESSGSGKCCTPATCGGRSGLSSNLETSDYIQDTSSSVEGWSELNQYITDTSGNSVGTSTSNTKNSRRGKCTPVSCPKMYDLTSTLDSSGGTQNTSSSVKGWSQLDQYITDTSGSSTSYKSCPSMNQTANSSYIKGWSDLDRYITDTSASSAESPKTSGVPKVYSSRSQPDFKSDSPKLKISGTVKLTANKSLTKCVCDRPTSAGALNSDRYSPVSYGSPLPAYNPANFQRCPASTPYKDTRYGASQFSCTPDSCQGYSSMSGYTADISQNLCTSDSCPNSSQGLSNYITDTYSYSETRYDTTTSRGSEKCISKSCPFNNLSTSSENCDICSYEYKNDKTESKGASLSKCACPLSPTKTTSVISELKSKLENSEKEILELSKEVKRLEMLAIPNKLGPNATTNTAQLYNQIMKDNSLPAVRSTSSVCVCLNKINKSAPPAVRSGRTELSEAQYRNTPIVQFQPPFTSTENKDIEAYKNNCATCNSAKCRSTTCKRKL